MKKAYNKTLSRYLEEKFLKIVIPRIPSFLHTHHFTYLTLLWSFLNIFFFYQIKITQDLSWFYAVIASNLGHYFSDMIDGELGRKRNTGLVRWGYYMDHFLDYLFVSSIGLGFCLILPLPYLFLGVLFIISLGGLMIQSYLFHTIARRLVISHFYIGIIELHFSLLFFFFLTIRFGLDFFVKGLIIIDFILFLLLYFVVFINQKRAWQKDSPQF